MSSDLTQLARRASLAVVLLVASVGTASAECAWVLWQSVINTVPGGSQEWGIMQAVRDQESCDAIRARHLANFKPSDEWSRAGDTLVYKPRAGGGGFVLDRTCLPDTVRTRCGPGCWGSRWRRLGAALPASEGVAVLAPPALLHWEKVLAMKTLAAAATLVHDPAVVAATTRKVQHAVGLAGLSTLPASR